MKAGQMKSDMQGFGKTLAGSAVFHAILFTLAFFVFGTDSGRGFITPVYTVDLVPGPRGNDAGEAGPNPGPEVKEETTKPEQHEEPAAKSPPAPTVKIKEKTASVDEELKGITKKGKRRT